MRYLIGWEDQKTGIIYNEFWDDEAPLLEVAFRFQKNKESEHPAVTVKVKSVTVMPPPPSQNLG